MKLLIIGSPNGDLKSLEDISSNKNIDKIFLTGNIGRWNGNCVNYYISAVKYLESACEIAPVYSAYGGQEFKCEERLKKLKEDYSLSTILSSVKNFNLLHNQSRIFRDKKIYFLERSKSFEHLKNIGKADLIISSENPFTNFNYNTFISNSSLKAKSIFFGDSRYNLEERKIGEINAINLGSNGYKILEL